MKTQLLGFFLIVTLAASPLRGEEPAAPKSKPAKKKPAAKEDQAERDAEKNTGEDDEKSDAPSQAELDKRFEKLLSGATLVGHFTVSGAEKTEAPKEEKYTLSKVSKLAGDMWLFQVRIQYGDHDVTVPLPIPVKWTGETPMIVLDKVAIPMLGTFSARVVFHEGKYAGTWSGGDHGGHLFGRIVPPKE